MSSHSNSFDQAGEPNFDPSYRPTRRRSNTWTVIALILGIGGLAFLVCCGGGLYFFGNMAINEVPAARKAAEAFIDDLKADRIEEAYARTATIFQNATTEDQFRALLDVYPAATTHTSRTIQLVNMHGGTRGGTAVFRVTFEGPDGTSGCTLSMVKENGEWKVAGLNLDASMLKPPTKPDDASSVPSESAD